MTEPATSGAISIHIGRKTEVMTEERRSSTASWADELRAAGLEVDLVVTEYEPGRRGLTLIEWTLIFVAAPAGQVLLKKITEDLYEGAKHLLRKRWASRQDDGAGGNAGGRHLGFRILGPNGEVLKEWTTKDGDREIDDQ